MSANRSSIFLEIIESLSKSVHISEGNEFEMAREILHKASNFLRIERANAWQMSDDESKLVCLLAYSRKKDEFYSEGELYRTDFPKYFNHISRNEIIISTEAQKEPFNSELVDNYLIPHAIYSMMEVPILSGGKLKGIICFEHLHETRTWTNDEQHFALALAQLLTLTLETKEKNRYRDELEKLVHEKTILIAEINHRVKNNLAVMTALIRAEKNRAKDDYHRELFDNVLSKSFSLSTLQNAVYKSQNYQQVNFKEFLGVLVQNMNETYGYQKRVEIQLDLDDLDIEISKAIPLSLIANEILTNCFKYAFTDRSNNCLRVELKNEDGGVRISISDNGPGLPENYSDKGTGFELISGLTEQIDGDLEVKSGNDGTSVHIRL